MEFFNSQQYIRYMAQNTQPSMAYHGEPLAAWQTAAREKLTQLLQMPTERCDDGFYIEGITQFEDYEQTDFAFQSEPGYFVRASFLRPNGIISPNATVVCLQGHSSGMHISLGQPKFPGDAETIAGGRDFAVRAVKEGVCAVAMEQRYMGSAGQTEEGKPLCLDRRASPTMATLLMGRTAIGERVWDIMRLIDVLFLHFDRYVDREKMMCLGNSGGGTATFYASCLDERIKISVPSCALCTYDDSIMAMFHCPCNFIPGIRKYFNMGDLGCLIAPRKLVAVCGVEDKIFPLPGVEKSFATIQSAYDAIGKGDDCALVKGSGGHQFYPDEAWPVIHKYLEEI